MLLFFSMPLFAQQLWWVDTTAAGEERKIYLGNYEKLTGGLYHAPLPVKGDMTVSGGATSAKQDLLINELVGGKSYGRTAALSGSSVDTTKGSLFSYWFDASYYATCTTGDTVYASSDATFPATNRIVLTAASPYLYTGKLFKSSIPNFYLKRKAGAATIQVQIYKRGF